MNSRKEKELQLTPAHWAKIGKSGMVHAANQPARA
jgi:hypothetical protein